MRTRKGRRETGKAVALSGEDDSKFKKTRRLPVGRGHTDAGIARMEPGKPRNSSRPWRNSRRRSRWHPPKPRSNSGCRDRMLGRNDWTSRRLEAVLYAVTARRELAIGVPESRNKLSDLKTARWEDRIGRR